MRGIIVTQSERKERLDICHACEFYKKETDSCGTLRALKWKGDLVEYEGKEYRLCGCVMSAKSVFKTFGCPIGKWGRLVTERDLEPLQELLNEIERGRVKTKVMNQIIDEYNKVFGTNLQHTTCGKCAKQIVKEIRTAIQEL